MFGPYADHADCVARHGDKVNPHAFCAWLEHQLTGKWPSQSQAEIAMPEAAWETFRETYAAHLNTSKESQVVAEKKAQELALAKLAEAGWLESRIGWVKEYAAPKMRTLLNVRIFAVGTWTDSAGEERKWTEEDILKLVGAFNAGVPGKVPAKLGHTPDNFNLKVAEKMGVPVEALTGLAGQGAPALGRMATLELRGPLLVASFERVPEPMADMVESGLLEGVSVEIEGPIGEFSDVITAVAFLGVEEPAVDLATLDRALVFGGKRENARVFYTKGTATDDLDKEFALLTEGAEKTIKGMRGAPIFRELLAQLRTKFKELKEKRGNHSLPPDGQKKEGTQMGIELLTRIKLSKAEVMAMSIKDFVERFKDDDHPPTVSEVVKAFQEDATLVAIVTALGLPEGATIEDVLTAIETLKGAGGGGGAVPPGMQAEFAKSKTELAQANVRIAVLEKTNTMHDYLEQTLLFSAIPGKSAQEIAEEIVGIHYSQNKAAAEKMLATYTELDKMGQAALLATGSSLPGAKRGDFEEEVTKYQKDHPDADRVVAVKACMKSHPALYQALVKQNRGQ